MSDHYFSSSPKSRLEMGLIDTVLRGRRYRLLTASGLFSAKKIDLGTRVLVESMDVPEVGGFLDVGCGMGVIGVVAASISPGLSVTMTDVNERATMVASMNVDRLGLGNARVATGNLYEPVEGEKFDTIVSNPPISAGMRKVVKPLVTGAVDHLVEGGSLQLVIQSNKGGKALARLLDESFGGHSVVERKSGYRVLAARMKR
ncbi:class I SAM-dependent methyltransferase [Candidatus Bathyarchaeota archaeon]|nr:class I SAM-dependent methyltransferase [Candidatus Bathyarchaeota archaeon]